MKINLALALIITSFSQAFTQNNMTVKKDTVITDTLSYALGNLLGTSLKQQGFNELHIEDLSKGILHAIVGMSTMDLRTCDRIVNEYQQAQQAAKYGPLKEKGEKFLAENLKKATVHVTPSGLQYEIIREGAGKKPGPADSVTVHYEGIVAEGKDPFDSSYKRGQPITFMLNQVIPGWTEGLQLMKEGSKYKLYIPYNLGYGEAGAGDAIPPFATLVFDVELIKVGSGK